MKIDGFEVVDAKHPITIHITSGDVKRGGVKNPTSCAAARACIRDLKLAAARVHLGRIYLLKDRTWVRYMTPASLRTEIVAFDRGGNFEAGDYELKPPAPSTRLGFYKPTGPKKRKVRRRITRHTVVGVRPPAQKGKGEA